MISSDAPYTDLPEGAAPAADVFSFDAETDGLWGRAFAIAATVYHDGTLKAEFFGRLHSNVVRDPWVIANVLPSLRDAPATHATYSSLLADFAGFYLRHAKGSDVVVHMPVPVEARLLIDMRDTGLIGEWDGPFPLIDVSGLLLARGEDPASVDAYNAKHNTLGGYRPKTHHPRCDCIATTAAYLHLRRTPAAGQSLAERTEDGSSQKDTPQGPDQ